MHLLIIDGMNLIRRVHAVAEGAGQVLIAESIQRCSGIVNRLMGQFQPTHAVICFDGAELSWRHHLYAGYKQGRKPKPTELEQSLVLFRQEFANIGVASLALAAVEADDLAATLVGKMAAIEGQVTLVSTDKGFGQLLQSEPSGKTLTLWNHFDRQVIDATSIKNKFGVMPWQLTDYWGLVGDSTNAIPGVKGVGAKTAVKLIEEYDTLDKLYQHLDRLTDRQQKLLQAGRDAAFLSRRLATLDQSLDLGCSLKDFRCKTGSYNNV